ncbi:MAG: hypothetical protein ACLR4Z_13365 [Butyricicoccaceae bacterium]
MKRDAEALKQYLERQKSLNEYREFCTEWNSHSETTFEVIGEWSDCSNVCDAEYLKKSVTAYLKATRGKNVPDMENIKEALQLARHAAKHTAFVFLLICIQKRDCIAARKDGKRDLNLDEVSFPANVYQKEPSEEKQRKARLAAAARRLVSSFMITKKQCEKTFCIFLNCMATEFCLRKRRSSGKRRLKSTG